MNKPHLNGIPTEYFEQPTPPPARAKRTHRVERATPVAARPAPRKGGGLTRFIGRRVEGFASALFILGAFFAAIVVDTAETYYGMEALSAIRDKATGAGVLPLWFVVGVTALIFLLANGSQWKLAAKWDEWKGSPRVLIEQVPFFVVTAILAGLQVGIAGLGGYAFFAGTPDTLAVMKTPWGLFSLGVSAFFSLALQFVATRRLVRSATPQEAR